MTLAITALAILVVAWFAAGTVWNVRKGSALMRWMQGGLPALGERTTVRWLGSTAVEMVIQKARAPFEQVVLVIFLEPRDVPWMWALGRGRGRRDTLIIRGRLRRAPRGDAEALLPGTWSGQDALRSVASPEWSVRRPASPGGLATWYQTPAALARAEELVALAAGAGLEVRRLSLRRAEPHLQLHVGLPPAGASASAFFETVRALGERAPA